MRGKIFKGRKAPPGGGVGLGLCRRKKRLFLGAVVYDALGFAFAGVDMFA